jgi:hypothetical protein
MARDERHSLLKGTVRSIQEDCPMKKHFAAARQPYYSLRAVLAAIGLLMRAMGILQPIYEQVRSRTL